MQPRIEDQGNPAQQAMGLIRYYEDLIRKKNTEIEELNEINEKIYEQGEYWKYRYYSCEVLWGKWAVTNWLGSGVILGMVGLWLIEKL